MSYMYVCHLPLRSSGTAIDHYSPNDHHHHHHHHYYSYYYSYYYSTDSYVN